MHQRLDGVGARWPNASSSSTAASAGAGAATHLAQLAARLPDARDVVVDGARVEARVGDGPGAVPELLRAAGVRVPTAQVHRPTLDDVFLTPARVPGRGPGVDRGAGNRRRRAHRRHPGHGAQRRLTAR
ncbi:MAG: hypothetical protein ACRDSZ_03390 [Pseudonocardiaceae bacterium]